MNPPRPAVIGNAASMVLLNDARRGHDGHWLAYSALELGIAATLARTWQRAWRPGRWAHSLPRGQPLPW